MNKDDISAGVFFNGRPLALGVKQSRSHIANIKAFIPKNIISDNNTVKIVFSGSRLPDDFDIRIKNYSQAIGHDMYIFSKSFVPGDRKSFPEILSVCALFIFLFCALPLRIAALAPFLVFLAVLHGIKFFSPYQVLLDKLTFIYAAAANFLAVAFFLFVRNAKQIAVRFGFARIWKAGAVLLLMNAALVCAACAIGEILTRVYHARFYRNSPFQMEDIYLGSVYTPNFKGFLQDKVITINSQGLRNRETALRKSEHTYRIACIGDSITLGYGLEDGQSYVTRLEELLNNAPGKKCTFEAINYGQLAFNMYQERLFLERKALPYDPDLVILQVALNDLTCGVNIPSIVNTQLGFNEGYSFEDMPRMTKVKYLLARKSYFFQYLLLKFRVLLRQYHWMQPEMAGLYSKEDIEMFQGKRPAMGERRFKEELLRIKELLAQKKIRFIVVVFPNDIQLGDEALQAPQKMIRQFCQANTIPCLDLLPVYSAHKDEPILIDIGHPSAYGNRLAAEEIYAFLKVTENSL